MGVWMQTVERWLLGCRYKPTDISVHLRYRAALHENRNVRMVAMGKTRAATEAANRSYDTAQEAIRTLNRVGKEPDVLSLLVDDMKGQVEK